VPEPRMRENCPKYSAVWSIGAKMRENIMMKIYDSRTWTLFAEDKSLLEPYLQPDHPMLAGGARHTISTTSGGRHVGQETRARGCVDGNIFDFC
jgi:hypothetical protein